VVPDAARLSYLPAGILRAIPIIHRFVASLLIIWIERFALVERHATPARKIKSASSFPARVADASQAPIHGGDVRRSASFSSL